VKLPDSGAPTLIPLGGINLGVVHHPKGPVDGYNAVERCCS
jgi:hypothetical protein